jgi:hypothetical protein
LTIKTQAPFGTPLSFDADTGQEVPHIK